MGYYTHYELSFDRPEKSVKDEFVSELNEKGIEIPEGLSLESTIDVHDYVYSSNWTEHGSPFPEEECKWYGHDEDMKKLSKKFPNILFKLKGEGEESGDMWMKYFKNGKQQTCNAKVTFDDFDETKMK